MADQGVTGSNWSDDELDAIVADHFAMLRAQSEGQPYVKAHHARLLMERTGRSHRSVEFKHMNISAVLAELGLRTTTPPTPNPAKPRPPGLVRIIRKFDPAARDHRNRTLGRLGEQRVFDHERAFLMANDRADLARKIEWTSQERGDGAGYDIRSYAPDGRERLIEVKATRGGATTDFFLTRTEREVSQERPEAWSLYRLHDLPTTPGLFQLKPPLEAAVNLNPETWRAGFE